MNILFLDYDGVVNTPMWSSDGKKCRFNFPEDNKVNNFQCVQWVSEFCEKCDYKIVVSSTWRTDGNYAECLKNGGLRDGVEVVGTTPVLPSGYSREDEIRAYLTEHPEVEDFMIFDDEPIHDFEGHYVECNGNVGFGLEQFYEAEALAEHLKNERLIS